MRVLMTTDPIGGVWTYSLDLCRELARRGHDVVLASMGGPASLEQRAAARATGADLRISELRLEWMDDPWRDVDLAGEWLLRLESEERPDVVHLNGYVHAALPWRVPCLVVAHSCVVSWWWAVCGEDPPPRYDEYRRRVRAGLQAADAVVAPTRFMLQELQRHYGPLPTACVIANGRAHDRFHPRAKWPFVASAGRLWDPAKNLAALVEITRGLPWPLFVAGDSKANVHDTSLAETAPPTGMRFVGRLDEAHMARLLGHAAVYVHPARYEPFGLVVLEAASAGCALVLAELPSLRETWDESALFVDPDRPEEMEEAIRHLVLDASARAALGARARSRAGAFTSGPMAGAYEALYRRAGKGIV